MPADHRREGYSTVSPYLIADDPAAILRFLEATCDARVIDRTDDGERIRHLALAIGDDGVIMVGGAAEEWPATSTLVHIYVPDCDAAYASALEAGATAIMPPSAQDYGDRAAGVRGPQGNTWWFATAAAAG